MENDMFPYLYMLRPWYDFCQEETNNLAGTHRTPKC